MPAAKAKQRIHEVSGLLQRESYVASLFYCKGILQYKCIPKGTIINKRRYKAVPAHLWEAISL
jgi:hypothetical protein